MFFKKNNKNKKESNRNNNYSNLNEYDDLIQKNKANETAKINLDSFDLDNVDDQILISKYSNFSNQELWDKLNNESLSEEEIKAINNILKTRK